MILLLENHLVQISSSSLPGFCGEVDVVRVMDFAQVVEAASLLISKVSLGLASV